jgi:hypothetical protein
LLKEAQTTKPRRRPMERKHNPRRSRLRRGCLRGPIARGAPHAYRPWRHVGQGATPRMEGLSRCAGGCSGPASWCKACTWDARFAEPCPATPTPPDRRDVKGHAACLPARTAPFNPNLVEVRFQERKPMNMLALYQGTALAAPHLAISMGFSPCCCCAIVAGAEALGSCALRHE